MRPVLKPKLKIMVCLPHWDLSLYQNRITFTCCPSFSPSSFTSIIVYPSARVNVVMRPDLPIIGCALHIPLSLHPGVLAGSYISTRRHVVLPPAAATFSVISAMVAFGSFCPVSCLYSHTAVSSKTINAAAGCPGSPISTVSDLLS